MSEAGGESAGLSAAEAARGLHADGPNRLPDRGRRGWPAILAQAAREPMFMLLIGAAVLHLLPGARRESILPMLMVLLMPGMTLCQQARTERTLAALRELSAPAARCSRFPSSSCSW